MVKEHKSTAVDETSQSGLVSSADIVCGGARADRMEAAMSTIATAQLRTHEELPFLLEEYGPLVEFCRENRVVAPLKNNTYMHALAMTQIMFDRTDSFLRMVTGACGYGFITLLREPFIAMLHRLRKMKAMIPEAGARIIVVNGMGDSTALKALENEFKDVLKVERATTTDDSLVQHYIVCDDDMIRDEKPHKPLTPQSPIDAVKADVYFYNPKLARVFSHRFDNLWNQLSQVNASKAK